MKALLVDEDNGGCFENLVGKYHPKMLPEPGYVAVPDEYANAVHVHTSSTAYAGKVVKLKLSDGTLKQIKCFWGIAPWTALTAATDELWFTGGNENNLTWWETL